MSAPFISRVSWEGDLTSFVAHDDFFEVREIKGGLATSGKNGFRRNLSLPGF